MLGWLNFPDFIFLLITLVVLAVYGWKKRRLKKASAESSETFHAACTTSTGETPEAKRITALRAATACGPWKPGLKLAAAEKVTFPMSVQVIPGKLKMLVFPHDIKYQDETISCWSYVTEGMTVHNQKEIIFTLRRDEGHTPGEYPRDFLELFATIFHFAEQGQLVDAGDVSLFAENGFLGRSDFRGIGYVEPQGFSGVETNGAPLLAGILLKGDEAQIAWTFGTTRVASMLGMKYHYYPCPTWSDPKRDPVTSLEAMNKSTLGEIARTSVRASYYEEDNQIFLSLLPSSREELRRFLRGIAPEQPLALRTQVDRRANTCLVWTPNRDTPVAITLQDSSGSRKTGAFLAFVPDQTANEIRMIEDGFALFLTNDSWQNIRAALESGANATIPVLNASGACLTVEWQKTEYYTSPVTGERFACEGWTTFKPEVACPLETSGAVTCKNTVLLTIERALQTRVTVEDLAAYRMAIEKAVESFFTHPDRKTGCDLAIQFELRPGGQSDIQIATQPNLGSDSLRVLSKELTNLPPAIVSGPVKLEFIFGIWGGARKDQLS